MLHIVFEQDVHVLEDEATLRELQSACAFCMISRTFSGWEQLSYVRDVLQMLGYTAYSAGSENNYRSYQIVGWYGEDKDESRARELAESK